MLGFFGVFSYFCTCVTFLTVPVKTPTVYISPALEAVAAGSRDAFNSFYRSYYDLAFRFSYYFLPDKEACREVVSEVFYAVWQSRSHLREVANVEAYLYVVVRREAGRYRTSRGAVAPVSLEDVPFESVGGAAESPEEQCITREMEALLARAVEELPEKCRLIFLLARQEGKKPKEIAELLSLSESTVRVQMKIAVEKIVARLKPHFPHLSFMAVAGMLGFFLGRN